MIQSTMMSGVGRPAKSGFTLVELLVVIGIIALLISILLPSLNKARQQAKEVACSSNLRQMGLALTMYANDWKYFPGARSRTGPGGTTYAIWPTRLRKYMGGNQKAFRCPSQSDDRYEWPLNDTTPPIAVKSDEGYGYKLGESLLDEKNRRFSYGYNDWGSYDSQKNPQRGLGGDIWPGGASEVKYASVRNATELIVIADRSTTVDTSYNPTNFNISLDPTNYNEAPSTIHRGGANFLHADGHVDWKNQKDVVLYDVYNPNSNIKWSPTAAPKYAKPL